MENRVNCKRKAISKSFLLLHNVFTQLQLQQHWYPLPPWPQLCLKGPHRRVATHSALNSPLHSWKALPVQWNEAFCSTFPLDFISFDSASFVPLCKTEIAVLWMKKQVFVKLFANVCMGQTVEESRKNPSPIQSFSFSHMHIHFPNSPWFSCSLQASFFSLAITLIHTLLKALFTRKKPHRIHQ